jgi:hypothetical protein
MPFVLPQNLPLSYRLTRALERKSEGSLRQSSKGEIGVSLCLGFISSARRAFLEK